MLSCSLHFRYIACLSLACSRRTACKPSLQMPRLPEPCLFMQDCLQAFTEVEELDEDDGYRCPSCKQVGAATKQLSIYRQPQVLILHLKRFSSSNMGSGIFNRFASFSKVMLLQTSLVLWHCEAGAKLLLTECWSPHQLQGVRFLQ